LGYFLNKPISLKNPIKKKFSQKSAIRISFDEIENGKKVVTSPNKR